MRQRILEAIAKSADGIKNEMIRTGATQEEPVGNSWLDCYATRLAILNGLLMLAKGILPEEEISLMKQRLEVAINAKKKLKTQQENDFTPPSEDDQQKLLQKLNIMVDAPTEQLSAP